jgi:lipopolysaccharide biosynthesis glycosyltransferase
LKRLLYQFHVDFKDRSKNVFGESFDRVAVGEYWKHSTTFAKAYCERYGIDYKFEFLSEEEYKPWAFGVETFDQYRAVQHLKDYDQVLYVDTDVIIHQNADNIFEEFKDSGLLCYFNNIADKYIHRDNSSLGRLNSGVLLFNNYHRALGGGKKKLYDMNIHSGNYPSVGTSSEEHILKKYSKGRWWEHWEEKHLENLVHLKNKTPSDENFLDFIISMYVLVPFHIGRKYNYRKNFKEKPLVRHGSGMIETSPSFIHYEGATKSLIHKDFEEGLFFE